ncbi:ATP-binding cassette domain-containing protein [Synechococcus sp. PCC 7336]|uniref:ABC transporter ATP-binding protein n=1 Tax=Synechococcus sp. PCC 7336 TaxID=195250 RepID=UPI00057082A6|nr:ATP-binding cassette domain-containing protein [Synechococcus sp. PCC 7336]
MSSAILEANNLSHKVKSQWLWQNLSFSMKSGDRVALIGPSGSGKTVLLRTLSALAPLQQGNIRFRDRELSEWEMPQYRAQVMYLPQRPALPEASVEEAIREPLSLRVHRHKQYDRAAVSNLLEILDRDKAFLVKQTSHLSGGERQIVAFLRAVMLQPTVLLLDEPTASLDEKAATAIEAAIASWIDKGNNRACLWTSHNPLQLERVTTRQIRL